MKTISRAEYTRLLILVTMASRYWHLLEDVDDEVLAILKWATDEPLLADFVAETVFSGVGDVDRLLERLGITVDHAKPFRVEQRDIDRAQEEIDEQERDAAGEVV